MELKCFSSYELNRNPGLIRKEAEKAPVIITARNKPNCVMLPYEWFAEAFPECVEAAERAMRLDAAAKNPEEEALIERMKEKLADVSLDFD